MATKDTAATTAATRIIKYNGMTLDDVGGLTIEQIRDFYAGVYSELQNAKIKGPDKSKDGEGNDVQTYTFVRNTGNLG